MNLPVYIMSYGMEPSEGAEVNWAPWGSWIRGNAPLSLLFPDGLKGQENFPEIITKPE